MSISSSAFLSVTARSGLMDNVQGFEAENNSEKTGKKTFGSDLAVALQQLKSQQSTEVALDDKSPRPSISKLPFTLGCVTLRKVETKQRVALSDLPTDSLLAESNVVHVPETSLKFEVSEYPSSKWAYWRNVVIKGHSIGIQLHKALSYHLEKVDSSYEIQTGKVVSLKEVRQLGEGLVHRVYQVEETGHEKRTYDHFSLEWEDLKLPEKAPFLRMMQLVKSFFSEENSVHIHCLSGRGRSGTVVFTSALSTCARKDPESLLEALREQRQGLVETEEQKAFAIDCANELATSCTSIF